MERFQQLPTDPHKPFLLSAFDIQQFTNVFFPTNLFRNKRIWVEKRVTELQWDYNICFIIWHAAKQFIVLEMWTPPPPQTTYSVASYQYYTLMAANILDSSPQT